MIDRQDWGRHQLAPWVLRHDDADVGVGGFRIGFGQDGLEFTMTFRDRRLCWDLAPEFVDAALSHAIRIWRADRFFTRLASDDTATVAILTAQGFAPDDPRDGFDILRLRR